MPEPVIPLPGEAEGRSTASVPIPYLDDFSDLDGAVPNLAATLTTQAEEDAEEANVSFLRGTLPETGDGPTTETHEASRRRRRRAVDAMLASELRGFEDADNRIIAAGSRAQAYRGWAPEPSDDEHGPRGTLPRFTPEDDEALARLNNEQRVRIMNHREELELRLAARAERRAESQYRDANGNRPALSTESANDVPSPATESSLRTTALLQAVRRNSQFSQYSRDQLQRYILDRERVGAERDQNRDAGGPERTPAPDHLSPSQRRQISREATIRQGALEQRQDLGSYSLQLEALEQQWQQRRHWPAPLSSPARDGRSLDKIIQYLERLRLCESQIEATDTAQESGFERDEREETDFLSDTTTIPSPQECSWLHVGAILSGTQSAVTPSTSNPTSSRSYTPLLPPQYRSRTIRHPTFGPSLARTTSPVQTTLPTTYTPSSSGPVPQRSSPPPAEDKNERWPVKVSIHGIDYHDMTICGTMEAFNVPDKSSPTRQSSITTFLEGEIIDFNKHALETKTFKADTRVDAIYWRKLPPFRDLKDDDSMINRLLSQEWIRSELMEKWILMRWKEKCFVHPSDAQSSLSINGFYYLSLRRADGRIEGLYYDPSSTPYQHLILQPETRTFAAHTFQ